jgi:hypothetical protein
MNITHEHYPRVGAYVRFWKRLKEVDPETRVPCAAWDHSETAGEALRGFSRAVNNRINSRGGLDTPRGRNDNTDYYWQEYRDKRAIEDHNIRRVRIYQFETSEARRRFSNLLSRYDED